MTTDKLTEAVQLIQQGNKSNAILILEEIVNSTPDNEDAWLWLASCVEDIENKEKYLHNALMINPNNQNTQSALNNIHNSIEIPTIPRPNSPESADLGKRTTSDFLLLLIPAGLLFLNYLPIWPEGFLAGGSDLVVYLHNHLSISYPLVIIFSIVYGIINWVWYRGMDRIVEYIWYLFTALIISHHLIGILAMAGIRSEYYGQATKAYAIGLAVGVILVFTILRKFNRIE